MQNPAKFWDERYGEEEYAYGEEPNVYMKNSLVKFTPKGKLLFPAEGEGRNAVFAAKQGWKVSAFDMSEMGKVKADKLALRNNVSLDYKVGELQQIQYEEQSFDGMVAIYAHFPGRVKISCYKNLVSYLKKGAFVIFEAFSKKHIEYQAKNPKVGGPKDLSTLFSLEEVQEIFSNFSILELKEEETSLEEGSYHVGLGSVIRFIGIKQ